MRLFLLLLAVVVVASYASLSSPLTSQAATSLYGSDCSEWCLNGTIVLQPRQFGDTNQFCTDARGCYWRWRLRIVPCSMSLLGFDAEVGPDAILYSQIDAAAHATLAFYCTESDSGSTLELRSHGAPSALMEWRYQLTTCLALLGHLQARVAPFSGSQTSVELGVQTWFGDGAERLEDLEVDCAAPEQQAVLAPCTQCFAGTQLAALPRNTSDALTVACGFAIGGAASGPLKECQVRWRFCYDACSDKTTHAEVRLGAGTDLARVNKHAGAASVVRTGAPDSRGRTLFALTDAGSVQALDDGYSTFYLAWEYREAPDEELWRAPARDGLFVALHFALQTDAGDELLTSRQLGADIYALGAFAWDGVAPTGIDAVVHAAKTLSSTEGGLVAGIVIIGVLCIIGWLCVAVLLWRQRPTDMAPMDEHIVHALSTPPPARSAESSRLGAALSELERERCAHRPSSSLLSAADEEDAQVNRLTQVEMARRTLASINADTAYLVMDTAELQEHERRQQVEADKARQVLAEDYQRNGGRVGSVLSVVPGGTTFVRNLKEGQRGLEQKRASVAFASQQKQ